MRTMSRGRAWHAVATLLAILSVCAGAQAQPANELQALNQRVSELHRDKKSAEAIPFAEKSLKLTLARRGKDHIDTQRRTEWLAQLYREVGRFGDAETLYKRSLAMNEKALGPDHLDVAESLDNLALVYRGQKRFAEAEAAYMREITILEKRLGPWKSLLAKKLNDLAIFYQERHRYGDAESVYRRSLAIFETPRGGDALDVATSLTNLAVLYDDQGRYADAEPLFKRALAIREELLGSDHPDVGKAVIALAEAYRDQGRYTDAEPLFKRSIAIREKTLGPAHLDVGYGLNGLAMLYFAEGRFGDAEVLYKRSLGIRENALGPNHAEVSNSLRELATLYAAQGRHSEAEALYKRALENYDKLGPDDLSLGIALNNLAELYRTQGRYSDAMPLSVRALAIFEKVRGPDHPDLGTSLNNLAALYEGQEQYAQAEPLHVRSLAIYEKALGPDHPLVGTSLNNLANIFRKRGRYTEAEPLYKRSLVIYETALGTAHPNVGRSLNNIARLHYAQSDWERAADFARRATRVIVDRAKRVSVTHSNSNRARGELAEGASTFAWLMLADWPLAQQQPGRHAELLDETFAAAQWTGQTAAGAALAQMAARLARGESKLATQVRDQQNLSLQWQQFDKAVITARTARPEERHVADEAALAQRLADTDRQLAALNARLIVDFPDYAALSSPEPLSIRATQKLLGPDEALVQFAFAEAESYVWAVSKTNVQWVKLALSPKDIAAQVELLRCGLDQEGEWKWSQQRQRWFALRASCATLRPDGLARKELPPFDVSLAYALYQGLLGPVQPIIANKHLLIVPSGVLAAIPFAALVTEVPAPALKDATVFRKATWLGRRQPITILPSVSSLRALREFAKPSQATQPLIGFGNPLLDGDPTNPEHALRAQEARTKVNCASSQSGKVQKVAVGWSADARAVYRNGQVDVGEIRKQLPLPETADELCAVARSLGASEADIYLGGMATKATVLKLSREGTLARYRVVHFATHGLLAGETEWFANGHAEPALLLTPASDSGDPSPSEEDNGLLTTSDVSELKLDADWVILSACNTASANATTGEEALSGLARAFFYAGARSLLVSHWYIDSDATVKLIVKAFDRLKADPRIGRAEALRQAMVALIDTGEAHPSYWAPFVLVGGGSAQAQ